jgi:hypothetical protein
MKQMVLINCEIDEPSNLLCVTFPSRLPSSTLRSSTVTSPTLNIGGHGSGGSDDKAQSTLGNQEVSDVDLPGFTVDLRVNQELTNGWEK